MNVNQRRIELVLKIVDLLPDYPKPSGMRDYPSDDSNQAYTQENCKEFHVPYLKGFVDIDTYIYHQTSGPIFRIQGYLLLKLGEFYDWDLIALEYLIELIKGKQYYTKITEKHGFTCLEVWNA